MSATNMAKPCDICGDDGVFEAIVTCCECKIARQHLYCMRIFRTEVPPFWSCEECDQNKLVSPRPSLKEHSPEASTQKVPSLMQTTTRVSGSQNKNAFASRFNFKEQRVDKGRVKYISCEEAVKLSSFAKQSDQPSRNASCSAQGSSKHMPPPRERTLVKTPQQERTSKFEQHLQQPVVQKSTGLKEKAVLLPLRNRGDATQSIKSCKRERETKTAKSEVLPPRKEEADTRMHIEVPKSFKRSETANTKAGSKNQTNVEAGSSDAGKSNLTTGMPVSERNRPYIPALHAYWKGSFYLPNGHESFNDAFKAHPPSSVHNKVYETLKKMPENIYFELVPKHEVWTDMFPDYCPDNDDIGLYFFPRFKKRSENSNSIMEFLWRKNLLMRSVLDGVELLVLSSRLLQPHSQEFQGSYFLWGVFRRIGGPNVIKKAVQGEVVDRRPFLEAKREAYDGCPPGFEKICKC